MTSPDPAAYSERLRVPVSWWMLGLAFVVSVGWAFFVSTPIPATLVATAVTAALVGTWLSTYGSALVRVDRSALYAGRAVLPRANIGAVEALDEAETRQALGAGADARAFLLTRPYCRRSVRVEVADVTDPTPYWLVSTRRPAAVAASLGPGGVTD